MRRLPLEGVKVIDLTQVQFGPCATQALGDFGADIIKIERPGVGDISRTTDPFITEENGESAYFMALNRNKRSIALDIRKPEGREIFLKLVEDADVVVHNFRPGVMGRLKLDAASLREKFPRLIYASGSGFGSTGPLARKGGQDLLAQSLSGLAMRNANSSGRPQLYPTALGDFSAGMILAQGILMALYAREKTGEGETIELCLLDTLLTMQQQEVTQWLLRRREVNWVAQYLIDVFNTRDGAVTLVGVFRDNPLGAVCEALDIEDLSAREEYATLSAQMQNRAALWEELGKGFAKFTTAECTARLDAADILCSEVNSLDEALAHPQVEENRYLVEFDHPVHGKVRTAGNPLKLDSVERISTDSAPLLGQHSTEILQSLGYDTHTIGALIGSGVVQQAGDTQDA